MPFSLRLECRLLNGILVRSSLFGKRISRYGRFSSYVSLFRKTSRASTHPSVGYGMSTWFREVLFLRPCIFLSCAILAYFRLLLLLLVCILTDSMVLKPILKLKPSVSFKNGAGIKVRNMPYILLRV